MMIKNLKLVELNTKITSAFYSVFNHDNEHAAAWAIVMFFVWG